MEKVGKARHSSVVSLKEETEESSQRVTPAVSKTSKDSDACKSRRDTKETHMRRGQPL